MSDTLSAAFLALAGVIYTQVMTSRVKRREDALQQERMKQDEDIQHQNVGMQTLEIVVDKVPRMLLSTIESLNKENENLREEINTLRGKRKQ